MASGRSVQTATRLADGRVLVAGGFDDWAALATAEIYDPATRTWTPTGSMIEGRGYHTATLLPDGKVLVAGGRSNNSSTGLAVSSAELYDPATGTWTPTASMSRGRAVPHGDAPAGRQGPHRRAPASTAAGRRGRYRRALYAGDRHVGANREHDGLRARATGRCSSRAARSSSVGGNDSIARGVRRRDWSGASVRRAVRPGDRTVDRNGRPAPPARPSRPQRCSRTARCSSRAAASADTACRPGRARTTRARARPSRSCYDPTTGTWTEAARLGQRPRAAGRRRIARWPGPGRRWTDGRRVLRLRPRSTTRAQTPRARRAIHDAQDLRVRVAAIPRRRLIIAGCGTSVASPSAPSPVRSPGEQSGIARRCVSSANASAGAAVRAPRQMGE